MKDNSTTTDEFSLVLQKLYRQRLITERVYFTVRDAYDQQKSKQEVKQHPAIVNNVHSAPATNGAQKQGDMQGVSEVTMPTVSSPMAVKQPLIPLPPDKVSLETTSSSSWFSGERLVSTLLLLGIFFLGFAGLLVSTTTWNQTSWIGKIVLLILNGCFFFGTSELCRRKFHLPKTSIALWVLGLLYLPLVVLSLAYSNVLGTFWSLTGDGRYVLGITICCVMTSLSVWSARHRERDGFYRLAYSWFLGGQFFFVSQLSDWFQLSFESFICLGLIELSVILWIEQRLINRFELFLKNSRESVLVSIHTQCKKWLPKLIACYFFLLPLTWESAEVTGLSGLRWSILLGWQLFYIWCDVQMLTTSHIKKRMFLSIGEIFYVALAFTTMTGASLWRLGWALLVLMILGFYLQRHLFYATYIQSLIRPLTFFYWVCLLGRGGKLFLSSSWVWWSFLGLFLLEYGMRNRRTEKRQIIFYNCCQFWFVMWLWKLINGFDVTILQQLILTFISWWGFLIGSYLTIPHQLRHFTFKIAQYVAVITLFILVIMTHQSALLSVGINGFLWLTGWIMMSFTAWVAWKQGHLSLTQRFLMISVIAVFGHLLRWGYGGDFSVFMGWTIISIATYVGYRSFNIETAHIVFRLPLELFFCINLIWSWQWWGSPLLLIGQLVVFLSRLAFDYAPNHLSQPWTFKRPFWVLTCSLFLQGITHSNFAYALGIGLLFWGFGLVISRFLSHKIACYGMQGAILCGICFSLLRLESHYSGLVVVGLLFAGYLLAIAFRYLALSKETSRYIQVSLVIFVGISMIYFIHTLTLNPWGEIWQLKAHYLKWMLYVWGLAGLGYLSTHSMKLSASFYWLSVSDSLVAYGVTRFFAYLMVSQPSGWLSLAYFLIWLALTFWISRFRGRHKKTATLTNLEQVVVTILVFQYGIEILKMSHLPFTMGYLTTICLILVTGTKEGCRYYQRLSWGILALFVAIKFAWFWLSLSWIVYLVFLGCLFVLGAIRFEKRLKTRKELSTSSEDVEGFSSEES